MLQQHFGCDKYKTLKTIFNDAWESVQGRDFIKDLGEEWEIDFLEWFFIICNNTDVALLFAAKTQLTKSVGPRVFEKIRP